MGELDFRMEGGAPAMPVNSGGLAGARPSIREVFLLDCPLSIMKQSRC
jgi:hypothetical protein